MIKLGSLFCHLPAKAWVDWKDEMKWNLLLICSLDELKLKLNISSDFQIRITFLKYWWLVLPKTEVRNIALQKGNEGSWRWSNLIIIKQLKKGRTLDLSSSFLLTDPAAKNHVYLIQSLISENQRLSAKGFNHLDFYFLANEMLWWKGRMALRVALIDTNFSTISLF